MVIDWLERSLGWEEAGQGRERERESACWGRGSRAGPWSEQEVESRITVLKDRDDFASTSQGAAGELRQGLVQVGLRSGGLTNRRLVRQRHGQLLPDVSLA